MHDDHDRRRRDGIEHARVVFFVFVVFVFDHERRSECGQRSG